MSQENVSVVESNLSISIEMNNAGTKEQKKQLLEALLAEAQRQLSELEDKKPSVTVKAHPKKSASAIGDSSDSVFKPADVRRRVFCRKSKKGRPFDPKYTEALTTIIHRISNLKTTYNQPWTVYKWTADDRNAVKTRMSHTRKLIARYLRENLPDYSFKIQESVGEPTTPGEHKYEGHIVMTNLTYNAKAVVAT